MPRHPVGARADARAHVYNSECAKDSALLVQQQGVVNAGKGVVRCRCRLHTVANFKRCCVVGLRMMRGSILCCEYLVISWRCELCIHNTGICTVMVTVVGKQT